MHVSPLFAKLGNVMQLSFVPRDFEKALRFWTETMGVGPFFLSEHVKLTALKYRGESTNVDFSIAIAYWGDIQVELVRQHNDAPSIFKEWLDAGGDGLHHVCVVVPDMALARAACRDAGAVVLQEALLEGGEVIYVETGGGPGTITELIQLSEAGLRGFAYMRETARNWDGLDPIRNLR